MDKSNKVFIATSLDGYIADKNGSVDWLHEIPNPGKDDMGYQDFMKDVDAVIMGRNTFETVSSFDINWPYEKPVYVLSNTLTAVPDEYRDKVFLLKGNLEEILAYLHSQGYLKLYIDGGKTIQNFLNADLIDEMIITTIPTLLGKGTRLFDELVNKLDFSCVGSTIFLNQIVQNHFVRNSKKEDRAQ